ncbi:hypothetical protein DEJ45_25625 [Streptomyces venezuelae]|nr:hypothetical protein DEJ45_25625 [Streptomyces venezuelae]
MLPSADQVAEDDSGVAPKSPCVEEAPAVAARSMGWAVRSVAPDRSALRVWSTVSFFESTEVWVRQEALSGVVSAQAGIRTRWRRAPKSPP